MMTEEYFQEITSFLASRSWAESVRLIRHDVLETDVEEILITVSESLFPKADFRK